MVKYQVRFSKRAQKDKALLKSAGLDRKTKELIKIVSENPFQNPPPYEKLLGDLQMFFSAKWQNYPNGIMTKQGSEPGSL